MFHHRQAVRCSVILFFVFVVIDQHRHRFEDLFRDLCDLFRRQLHRFEHDRAAILCYVDSVTVFHLLRFLLSVQNCHLITVLSFPESNFHLILSI